MGMNRTACRVGDALFTRTQQKVIGLLYGDAERSFYANEIVRLAGVGTGAVQRELNRLTLAGLVRVSRIGNQKHYQANQEAPIFRELRSIAIKTFGVADVLVEALTALARQIEVAFIYGSLAKGTAMASSDIDVLIVGHDLTYADLAARLSDAEAALGRRVNPSIYTAHEVKSKLAAKNAFLRKVMEQPKIFLMGSEGELPEPRSSGPDR